MDNKTSIYNVYSKLDDILSNAVEKKGNIIDLNDIGQDGYNLSCLWYLESEGYLINNKGQGNFQNHQWRISPKGHILIENGGFKSGYQKQLELEKTREKLDRLQIDVSQSTLDTNTSVVNVNNKVDGMNQFSRISTVISLIVAVCSLGVAILTVKDSKQTLLRQQELITTNQITIDLLQEQVEHTTNYQEQLEILKQEVLELTMKEDSTLDYNLK